MMMYMIFLIIGIIIFLYGVSILSLIGYKSIFNYFSIFLGIFIIVINKLYTIKKYKKYINILLILSTIVFICFIVVEGFIIKYASSLPKENARYLIVLGSKVNVSGPSMDYQARLDKAYEYLKNNPDTFVIVTGAKGNDEPISEAQCGKNVLMEYDIKEDRIIIEDKSYSTYQNIDNARKLIIANGDNLNCDVVIVSSNFHLFRANYIAKKLGFTNLSFSGSRGLHYIEPHYFIREYFAFIKEVLFSN